MHWSPTPTQLSNLVREPKLLSSLCLWWEHNLQCPSYAECILQWVHQIDIVLCYVIQVWKLINLEVDMKTLVLDIPVKIVKCTTDVKHNHYILQCSFELCRGFICKVWFVEQRSVTGGCLCRMRVRYCWDVSQYSWRWNMYKTSHCETTLNCLFFYIHIIYRLPSHQFENSQFDHSCEGPAALCIPIMYVIGVQWLLCRLGEEGDPTQRLCWK
jgi:hypothetical protein